MWKSTRYDLIFIHNVVGLLSGVTNTPADPAMMVWGPCANRTIFSRHICRLCSIVLMGAARFTYLDFCQVRSLRGRGAMTTLYSHCRGVPNL